MKKIKIVQIAIDYRQALYLDGKLFKNSYSIEVDDLLKWLAGQEIMIESYEFRFLESWQIHENLSNGGEFPKNLEEFVKYENH